MTDPDAPRPASAKPSLPRRWARPRALTTILLALVATAVAAPSVLVAIGTRRARACIAAYAEPRGAELPDCRAEIAWFVTPTRVPWTAIPARYRAEELGAGIGIAE